MKLDPRLMTFTQPARRDLALTIGLGFLGGLMIVGQAFFLSRIVSRVFLDGYALSQVWPWLWALFGLSLLRAAFSWGSQVAAQRVASAVKNSLRDQLTAHILALGPAYTKGERSGELSNTIVEGVEALDAYFSQYVPQLALAALVPLTILFVAFPTDIPSALVLLFTAPLIPIFMILIGKMASELSQKQWVTLSRMSAHFLDVLQGLSTLKILGRSRAQIDIIRFLSNRFGNVTMKVLRVAFLSALVLETLASLSVAVMAVQIGLRLMYGKMDFEPAFFILILAPEFYLPLRLLGTRFHAAMSGVSAAQRIFQVLDTPLPPASPQPAPTLTLSQPLRLRFDSVGYTYPSHSETANRAALNNINLSLEPGQTLALVGPSGAGKSTLSHLLLRFIEPESGSITVNGHRLSDLEPAQWRQLVAWVPQRPYLFHGSVLDNIKLARPEATLAQVTAAAEQAHAHDFISNLPQGYQTTIGERGQRLSGGQQQRLALARAFLKDAPFLILDEATANLDPAHEQQVQAAISHLLKGRTALVIAHRLSTVYEADRIAVMDGGRIVQRGSHAELKAQAGLYQRLVNAYVGEVAVLGGAG